MDSDVTIDPRIRERNPYERILLRSAIIIGAVALLLGLALFAVTGIPLSALLTVLPLVSVAIIAGLLWVTCRAVGWSLSRTTIAPARVTSPPLGDATRSV